MAKAKTTVPSERAETPRAAIHEALLGAPRTARELSVRAGVSEKDVAAHLEHLERSARGRDERFIIKPAECLACGFTFRDRRRMTTPGSCPECRSERIAPPSFKIEPK